MSVGSWNPDLDTKSGTSEIDRSWLNKFILWAEHNRLDHIAELLSETEQKTLAPLMQKSSEQWLRIAEDYDHQQLLSLIHFFTVAENLPGWKSAEKSPVIPLARVLRKQGKKLDRQLLLWIREVSDNRFLPYGPL